MQVSRAFGRDMWRVALFTLSIGFLTEYSGGLGGFPAVLSNLGVTAFLLAATRAVAPSGARPVVTRGCRGIRRASSRGGGLL